MNKFTSLIKMFLKTDTSSLQRKRSRQNPQSWGLGGWLGKWKETQYTTCLNTVVQVQRKHMEKYTPNCYPQQGEVANNFVRLVHIIYFYIYTCLCLSPGYCEENFKTLKKKNLISKRSTAQANSNKDSCNISIKQNLMQYKKDTRRIFKISIKGLIHPEAVTTLETSLLLKCIKCSPFFWCFIP